jgi:hypothetical protein
VDIARQQQLQQSIAARIADALSAREWASVPILWSEIGLGSYSPFSPRDAAGIIVDIRIPRYDDEFEALRAEMADPETGAGEGAAVEALPARPLTLPAELEPLRSAWGWPVSALQRLWAEAAPVVGHSGERTSI